MPTEKTKYFPLHDGRILAYCEYGDLSGRPVFYVHGSPGSRLEGELFQINALQRKIRLIAVDRPGMGQSEYMRGRTLLDYPSDISALADALELDCFGVIGWSGGGPHALACAYAIPERLTSCLIIAGYTNFSELPNAKQYLRSRLDQIAIGLLESSPRLFACLFHIMNLGWRFFPSLSYYSFANTVHEVDRELLNHEPQIKQLVIDSQQEAFRSGIRGPVKDAVIQYQDWGFRLTQISTKVHVFHGNNDYLVPSQFSHHIASQIGQSRMHWFVDQGHFLPLSKMEIILGYT